MKMRLNKYIADSGITSRRKAEQLITEGRISINGQIVTNLAVDIDPTRDSVEYDGEKIRLKKKLYFLLNKPKGYITSTSDEKNRRTVIELINTREKIFPVGRLDYNTTGVLLLSNDGDFSNLLLHPKKNIKRIYKAILDHDISDEHIATFRKGIFIDNRRSVFTDINVSPKNKKAVTVTVVEGRNHFVKNMFSALGYTVIQLERISFAGFTCENLQQGQYRKLDEREVQNFLLNDAKI